MNLELPQDWVVDEATKGLLGDLDEVAYQINELRPLRPDVVRQVNEKLLGERVFSSNAIEGNTLTLRETTVVLQAGSVLGEKRRREAQEALNLADAYRDVEQLVGERKLICDCDKFLEIHAHLMKGVNDGCAGRLRSVEAMTRGAKHQPPDAILVSDLLDQFFEILALETARDEASHVHPLIFAAWAHWAITRIHPFEGGNGRMARLWEDVLLLYGKLTVAIIRPEDRSSYYEALRSADEGDCSPLTELVCRRVMGTMQNYLSAQGEADFPLAARASHY